MSARIEHQAVTDGWRAEGKYGFAHPSGWPIGRYFVNGVETYMLWHGNETQGSFSTADEAKRKHIDLCAWTSEMQAPEIDRWVREMKHEFHDQ